VWASVLSDARLRDPLLRYADPDYNVSKLISNNHGICVRDLHQRSPTDAGKSLAGAQKDASEETASASSAFTD
jgi:hypothetical protein